MSVSSRAKFAAVVTMVTVMVGLPGVHAAEEETPDSFVTLKFEGACDDENNRLWLSNTHTFKTIMATVRWKAAGGKDLTEQFYPGPATTREIGCAAEAEILSAQFANF